MLSDWEAECPVCDSLPSAAAVSSGHFAAQLTSSPEGEEKGDEGELQEDHFQFPRVSSGYEHSAVNR